MKKDFKKTNKNRGAAMLISVVFFLFISLAVISGLVTPSVREFRNVSANLNSKQSYFLAESGSEDVMYRILHNLPTESNETITLDGNSVTTEITTPSGNTKQISALGDVSNFQRKVDVALSAGMGMSFSYGMQIGNGGLSMSNGSEINGSVYVNGNITGISNSGGITGAAIAADRTTEVIDQINDIGTPIDIRLGSTTATQDGAQSFTVTKSDVITQVSIYVKKVGLPSNATIRITANSSGKPATTYLTTGTLSAANVTTSYGWVNIVLSSAVTLSPNTTYWLVIDTSLDTSKYYIWGSNSSQYPNGLAKLGQYTTTTWNNTSPSGLDAFFKIYLGGVNSTISGMDVGQDGVGDAWAHTVNTSNVAGDIYCQTGSGNNKSCITSRADPAPLNFPISDAQIQAWKDVAVAGGTQTGNISLSSGNTLIGPKKIVGNLSLTNSAILTLGGPLWVTGSITLTNSSQINLSSSYESGSGMLISDGLISTSNSSSFNGSGTTGSYIMVLTTSSSASAITIANSAGTVILVAPYGTISLTGYASVKEAIAKTINMTNNAVLIYDSGLINQNFVGGPSGSWSVNGWGESQ